MRRISSAYLWFSPLALGVLAVLYHLVSFWAGAVGGLVYLGLVVIALQANGAFKSRGSESSVLGPALLVIGSAIIWATGPSGPPDPAHLAVAEYNQAGLTLGFFVTLLGFAAMVPALASTRERAWASVGRACFALMFVGWWVDAAMRSVVRRSAFISMPRKQWPELLQLFLSFSQTLLGIAWPMGYLAGAVFAAMAIRAGWVRRGAGVLMLIYCLLGVPLSAVRVFLPVASLSDMPLFLYPYAPPALMCLIPYYIGVLRLKRAVVQADYVEP